MKKADIEKQLKEQLSQSAPRDFNAVWDKCVTPPEDGKERSAELSPITAVQGGERTIRSRKAISLTAIAVALLLCVVLILCFTLPSNSGDDIVIPSQSGFFIIEINPSMQVNYDINNTVTSVLGLNADGETLLSSLDLVGLTYDKAVDEIFDACEKRGYFSSEREDKTIRITATKDDGKKDEKMIAAINKKLTQKLKDKNIKDVVISDALDSK